MIQTGGNQSSEGDDHDEYLARRREERVRRERLEHEREEEEEELRKERQRERERQQAMREKAKEKKIQKKLLEIEKEEQQALQQRQELEQWRADYWKTLEAQNKELLETAQQLKKELEQQEKAQINQTIISPEGQQMRAALIMSGILPGQSITNTRSHHSAPSASISQPITKNPMLTIMLRVLNQDNGAFCSHQVEYEIYKKNAFILRAIAREKTDPANNPIAPYSNPKEEKKCKQNALKYIYSIKAELVGMGANGRGEEKATVAYTITQASKDLAARVICSQQTKFNLRKSGLNGHKVDLKCNLFTDDDNDDDTQKVPFSLRIRTTNA
jgi:hypothetical protein